MVKQITKQEIKNLLDRQAELCISIYMPIYKTGSEGRQNPIRFKNLISKAIDQLLERGMSLSDAENMLQPAKNILNNEMFWREQSNSFVVFCSRKFFECYSPEFFVEELVVAGNQFYIKPLLAYLLEDTDFFVLALSKNHLKLLSCNPFTYQEVELKNVPKNLKEALRFNDPERVLQFHTNTPRTPGARAAAIFHGHGVGIDDEKDDLLEYFRQIDRGVHLLLKDKKTPLVLASVDYFHPLYKKMNTYANLFEKGVSGNTELLTSRELYQKGREVLMPFLQKPLMQALAQYDEFAGTDRVSKNIQEILKAAKAGKVWNLFLQP
ncbi:MAG TPA: hypothetical protein VLH08_00630, partial [Acidobacteriota bacterium]|nr:hypothetical protein [Acidobacteriota bacterium]